MEDKKQGVVAIDGPSGSGKSTVAQNVAKRLGILYVDTGAMFRGIACNWLENNLINEEDLDKLKISMDKMKFVYGKDSDHLVEVNGVNYTKKIREHSISKMASDISKLPFVRDFLLKIQRELAESQVCVMEGRDIGTVVFPQAFCKVFLTATLEERTKRRFNDLEGKGEHVDIEKLKKDLQKRDLVDSTRETAPLKQADDAYYLDSSMMTQDQVTHVICHKAKEKASIHGFVL